MENAPACGGALKTKTVESQEIQHVEAPEGK
jgi:hypothetical protein